MELCRVCMRNKSEMAQLFDSNADDEIIDKIKFCTGILFTKMDMVPSKICQKCLEELHTAYKFKTNCIKSEQTFKELDNVRIKDEPNDLHSSGPGDVININEGAKYSPVCIDEDIIKNDDTDDDLFDDGDVLKASQGGFDYEVDIKVENTGYMNERLRKTKARLKNKEQNSVQNDENIKTKQPVKVLQKKRGPYNKTGQRRLAKLKFRKLFCERCNMKFTSKKESDDHKKEFHNEPELWICEICGKSFAHRSSQHSHMRLHYPPQHACDHCDYKTANKHDLNKHLRIHSGNKSYICPICAAAYRTSSNLHAHIRLTHERLRKYACTLCARTFYDRTKLNRHMDSHNDVKRYSCEVCHSCFTRRCYWKKHLQKQHDIVIPSCRPGRQKTSIVLVTTEKEVK